MINYLWKVPGRATPIIDQFTASVCQDFFFSMPSTMWLGAIYNSFVLCVDQFT